MAMYNTYMYALASQLTSLPILSLQTGETVAQVHHPIINPDDLEVVAYVCTTGQRGHQPILMVADIREKAMDCIIIDSEEELAETGDVIRLQELLARNFSPLDKLVLTDLGRRLGRIEDYTINLETDRIQKLYVQPPLWRGWFGSSLIIDRTQILDVTPRQIVVRDTTVDTPLLPAEPATETNS